jgi:uncharacterized membrane protein
MKHTKSETPYARKDVHGTKIEKSVRIRLAPATVYRFWKNLENLPKFMSHLESVKMMSPTVSHWVAKGPAGKTVEWDAEIITEIENELIGWQSLEGSDVNNAGSVRFVQTAPGETEVRVTLSYDPPGHKLGAAFAKFLGEDPAAKIAEDLLELKDLLES